MMTDTIDEQKRQREAMRPMTDAEIVAMQEKADAYQAYMQNAIRRMYDVPPVQPTRWQRFLYWIKDLFL